MNWVGFDLETESIPDDWDRRSPLAIACGAAYSVIETASGVMHDRCVWYAGMSHSEKFRSVDELSKDIEEGRVAVDDAMSPEEVELMWDQLASRIAGSYVQSRGFKMKGRAPTLVAWNSVGFDFPVLAAALPHKLKQITGICKFSLDPCFQFIRQFGWPIGLKNAALPMLGEGKFEGMTGAEAALWPLDAGKIVRYVMRDAELTLEVVQAIQAERQVRWIKQNGEEGAKPIPRNQWLTVNGTMKLKEPNRPWMSDYHGQYELEAMTAWMQE